MYRQYDGSSPRPTHPWLFGFGRKLSKSSVSKVCTYSTLAIGPTSIRGGKPEPNEAGHGLHYLRQLLEALLSEPRQLELTSA